MKKIQIKKSNVILTIYAIVVCFVFGFYMNFQHEQSNIPLNARVLSINKNCSTGELHSGCYYSSVVNYNGIKQTVNISRANYHLFKVNRTYDFSPSFSWFVGINGTAYSVDNPNINHILQTLIVLWFWISLMMFLLIPLIEDLFKEDKCVYEDGIYKAFKERELLINKLHLKNQATTELFRL